MCDKNTTITQGKSGRAAGRDYNEYNNYYSSNNFTITFKYNHDFSQLLNPKDVLNQCKEFISLNRHRELEIDIHPNDLKKEILIDLKKDLIDTILSLSNNTSLNLTLILDKFQNKEIHIFNNNYLVRFLQNQFLQLRALKYFFFNTDEKFDIQDLIEEFPGVDFVTKDKDNIEIIEYDPIEFIRFQISESKELLNNKDLFLSKFQKQELDTNLKEWECLFELLSEDDLKFRFTMWSGFDMLFNPEHYPLDVLHDKFKEFKLSHLQRL